MISIDVAQVHAEHLQGLDVAVDAPELVQEAPQPITLRLFPKEPTAHIHRLHLAIFLGQFRHQDTAIKAAAGEHTHGVIVSRDSPVSQAQSSRSGDKVGTLANVLNEVKRMNATIDVSNAPEYGISHD